MIGRALAMLGVGAIGAMFLAGLLSTILASGCVFYLSPSCTDQIRNGNETDVDCGGSCGRCDIGDGCRVDADCDDSTCSGGRCTALPCANGRLDPGETDVDCGGPTCHKCAGGRRCEAATDCYSGDCTAGANTCAGLSTVSFGAPVSYPSGSKTYALFTGDLDADGDLELVAANEQDSALVVFRNDGAGAFQRVTPAFPTGAYPTGGAIADMNGDGKPDVVTADYHGNSVSILLGDGTGALAAKATFPTLDGAETSNLAVGDVNGDGALDVVATNPQKASASLFLGRGNGTLAPAVDLPVGTTAASEPYSTAIGDFNGDNRADLAIADVRSGTIVVRLGNGDGTFQDEVPYAEGSAGPYILITRDMNVDGKLDLVCANRGGDSVSVLIGRGDGTFRKAAVTATGAATGPYAVAVADFNLDGVPDAVTANFMTGTATVLLGIGDGRFDPVVDAGRASSAPGRFSYGVAAGDFNGDGKPDIATANPDDNAVGVKLSTSH